MLSSGVSSGVGLLYWVIAARLFDPTTVGLNSAAISAMTLIGSAAHLNMGNAMLRFVPVEAGAPPRSWRRASGSVSVWLRSPGWCSPSAPACGPVSWSTRSASPRSSRSSW